MGGEHRHTHERGDQRIAQFLLLSQEDSRAYLSINLCRYHQRVLLPVSTNHTVCSMILKSNLSDMFSM